MSNNSSNVAKMWCNKVRYFLLWRFPPVCKRSASPSPHSPSMLLFTVHTALGLPGSSETAISDTWKQQTTQSFIAKSCCTVFPQNLRRNSPTCFEGAFREILPKIKVKIVRICITLKVNGVWKWCFSRNSCIRSTIFLFFTSTSFFTTEKVCFDWGPWSQ